MQYEFRDTGQASQRNGFIQVADNGDNAQGPQLSGLVGVANEAEEPIAAVQYFCGTERHIATADNQ